MLSAHRWGSRGLLAALAVLAVLVAVDALGGVQITGSFALAALAASILADSRQTAAVAVLSTALALLAGLWDGHGGGREWLVRAGICALIGAVSVGAAVLAERREERLRRMTLIAETAQRAVLRAMPNAVGAVGFAARYVSAYADALVGGDLYEVASTPYGVRVVIGDVRGKGLDAVQTAAGVLGAFRQAAVAQPDLLRVAAELDGGVGALLGEEDFVTVLLAEFGDDGCVRLVNCGHHPPLLVPRAGQPRLLDTGAPSTPLGMAPDPALLHQPWPDGARLLLYTDGLVEARNRRREFFPLDAAAGQLAHGSLQSALDGLVDRLLAHTGHRLQDDLALVLAGRP